MVFLLSTFFHILTSSISRAASLRRCISCLCFISTNPLVWFPVLVGYRDDNNKVFFHRVHHLVRKFVQASFPHFVPFYGPSCGMLGYSQCGLFHFFLEFRVSDVSGDRADGVGSLLSLVKPLQLHLSPHLHFWAEWLPQHMLWQAGDLRSVFHTLHLP